MIKGRKILIVDSDEEMRAALADVSRANLRGMSYVEASNGVEALDRLAEGGVAVVVTALCLDLINGAELVRAARAYDYAVDFVLVTGHPYTGPLAPDGVAVFRKPFEGAQLVEHVRALLRAVA